MMYSVADIEGLNRLSRRIIPNATLGAVGMVANEPDFEPDGKPTVGITMFGGTTPWVQTAREYLEDRATRRSPSTRPGVVGRRWRN